MPSFLQINAIGHLGRDPEIRTTPGGDQVANFSMAATEKYGETETTTWMNCSVWGKRASVIMQYVKKGDAIHVTGSGRLRTYTTKDGYEDKSLDIRVQDFTLLGGRRDGAQDGTGASGGDAPKRRPAAPQSGAPAAQHDAFDDDGDIPF